MKNIYQRLVESEGFSQAQRIVIDLVQNNCSVLEIGASSGYMTKEFIKKGCQVDAVELDPLALNQLQKRANKVFSGSIEDKRIQSQITGKYHIIACVDVLEHLVDPEVVLEFLKGKLKKDGYILISIPNIAFWNMRKQLFFKGDFTYQESGLLDKKHLRFFSLNNFLKLLKAHHFKVNAFTPAEARFPLEYSIKKVPILGKIFLKIFKDKIIWLWPNLTFYHYVIKATT